MEDLIKDDVPYHILILAFHRVNDFHRNPLTVGTELFRQQMNYLKEKGYNSVGLEELPSFHLSQTSNLSPRSVAITFDDGFQDNYIYAFPILKQFGFKATFFLTIDLIGTDLVLEKDTPDKPDLNKDRMLSWDEVRRMHEEGMDFGSHTCTHANLFSISKQQAEKEILDSYSKLGGETGASPLFFCYPYGAFNEGIKALVKKAGFKGAVVTPNRYIYNEDLFSLFRVGIYGHNNLDIFKFKISKYFRWLQRKKWFWDLRALL